ncbi:MULTISPECIES: hypothetical protein [unclassified Variovorax]|uniref:hypothetical protein n=1 Tax=unclassified Variovorax TaxID=663243 RepID=UPI00076BCC2C|nr:MULTISPECIES: hypothetical protein [unclassified Variovorax]KWT98056.1 hypothetical protein APY03_0727 [Variovorax sp. WDL1]PNG50469.1 hypothetical protein CHC06_06093 [Variovorax sp. B2]PNG51342.1 hypothetical protein CHC07_05999 [Variovorax sp. B4]VTU43191.1 hypothetical protein H6P1_00381 [Variovorax sp. PBL-H6]VTU43386.1 hypothetical protein SRS16P1_00524 [Variovorax sp. SRS16]
MTTKATLLRRIDAFLKTKKKSDGGFAPVDPKEMEDLYAIVRGLIEVKYEEDPDGDVPVEVILTDRTRFERPLHFPVQYAHKPVDGKSEFDLHLTAASSYGALSKWAGENASRHLDAVKSTIRDATEKHRPLVVQGVRYLAKQQAPVSAVDVIDVMTKEAVKAYKRNPCPVDYKDRNRWADALASAGTKKLGIKLHAGSCMHTTGGVRMYFEVPSLDTTVRVETGSNPEFKPAAKKPSSQD